MNSQIVQEKKQQILNDLIRYIETNPTQWEQGWFDIYFNLPINGKTERKYQGLNAIYLYFTAIDKNYNDPRWVTYNQAKDLKANVKKGEKSHPVCYYTKYDKKTKKEFDERTCLGMTIEEKTEYLKENVKTILKFYQVFNAEQCDNMPEYIEKVPEMEAEERKRQNEIIEQIISNSEAPICYDGGNKAYYDVTLDSIHIPEIKDFKTMQDYYATTLHEIAHSTGHESRLNRNLQNSYGTSEYAKEELRAELSSIFMQIEYGISIEGQHFENHSSYLASWLQLVKDDQNEFYLATIDAGKITKYISDNYIKEKVEQVEIVEQEVRNYAKNESEIIAAARIRAKQLVAETGEPYITINWSEYSSANGIRLNSGDIFSLSEADKILEKLNNDYKDIGYDKTKLDIDFIFEGKENSYEACRFDIGTESGGLCAHVAEYAAAGIEYSFLSTEKLNFLNAFSKYLNEHVQLSRLLDTLTEDETISESELQRLKHQIEETRRALNMTEPFSNYKDPIMAQQVEQVEQSQQAENTEEKETENVVVNTIDKKLKELEAKLSQERLEELRHNFEEETNEKETQDWRDMLSTDEEQLIEEWDKSYLNGTIEILRDIIAAAEPQEKAIKEQTLTETILEEDQYINYAQNSAKEKLVKFNISVENKIKEFGKATMFRLPKEAEYSSFVFLTPTKFVGKTEQGYEISVPQNFKFNLRNNNQEINLTGEELRAELSGQIIGKSAQRVSTVSNRNLSRLEMLKNNIPDILRNRDNWCVYKTKWNEEKEKKDKFVLSPIDGKWAHSNGPDSWADFETAYKYAVDNNCEGLSYALNGDGICCIDLDKCIVKNGKLNNKPTTKEDGEMNDTALKLVSELTGVTYCEKSASGNGLHFFINDDILKNGKYSNKVKLENDDEIEVYDNYRFISMTGDVVSEVKEASKCPMATANYIQELLGRKVDNSALETNSARKNTNYDLKYQSEADVIERIQRSKKGNSFNELYYGGAITGDKSRDDLAMLNILAFFTDCNESQMKSIFESSVRYRPQDKNEAYVDRTIRKACDSLTIRLGEKNNSSDYYKKK